MIEAPSGPTTGDRQRPGGYRSDDRGYRAGDRGGSDYRSGDRERGYRPADAGRYREGAPTPIRRGRPDAARRRGPRRIVGIPLSRSVVGIPVGRPRIPEPGRRLHLTATAQAATVGGSTATGRADTGTATSGAADTAVRTRRTEARRVEAGPETATRPDGTTGATVRRRIAPTIADPAVLIAARKGARMRGALAAPPHRVVDPVTAMTGSVATRGASAGPPAPVTTVGRRTGIATGPHAPRSVARRSAGPATRPRAGIAAMPTRSGSRRRRCPTT